MNPKKHIAILGSTGSIGTQALEVINEHSEHFSVSVLTAQQNSQELIAQALRFKPNSVVIGNEEKYQEVKDALWPHDIKVYAGKESLKQIAQLAETDMVLTALVGFSGLEPTLAAIEAGKQLALANKETLVVAGELVTKSAAAKSVNIYPVDSEHSAIFQCLAGEWHNAVEKIYLTASGGPFREMPAEALEKVSVEDALKHPNWSMGAKITIDSASMMNKGLEVIEARWLFNLKPEQIEVIVHPQSIIHSLVQFTDGSMKAQLGLPDMKLPIQYALAYPQRLSSASPRFNFADYPQLTFSAPDTNRFPNLRLAYEAMQLGGNMPCTLNAANEVAVEAFLQGNIRFTDIAKVNENALANTTFIKNPNLSDYLETDRLTREIALRH